jgi:hypothetical protein
LAADAELAMPRAAYSPASTLARARAVRGGTRECYVTPRSAKACVVPPVKGAQAVEGEPLGGLARRDVDLEPRSSGVAVLLQPGAVRAPRRADDGDRVREPRVGPDAVVACRREEVVGGLERAVLPAERVGEGRGPGADQPAGGQGAEQPALEQVLLAGLAASSQSIRPAGTTTATIAAAARAR